MSLRNRFSLTSRYLATGNSFKDLSYSSRIAANTIPKIIIRSHYNRACRENDDFFINVGEWQFIAHQFELIWNFAHCIGFLDGKHINFCLSRKENSRYQDYIGTDSIVLLGCIDAEYEFLNMTIGRNDTRQDSDNCVQVNWA